MTTESPAPTLKSTRLASLDAFRGMTIVAMLWVNNMATPQPLRQFTHAKWGEWITLCDFIFPWFLFITGVAMAFSWAARRSKGATSADLTWGAMKRSFLLFSLGAILDSSINKRFTFSIGGGIGVLQTIAISYLIASCFYRLSITSRATIAAVSIMCYYLAFRFINISGTNPDWWTQKTNFQVELNNLLGSFGLKGLVSSWPASALVLMGTCIGDLMRDKTISEMQKTQRLATAGIALVSVGVAWHGLFPVSKYVFSSSYVCFSAGTGCLTLGVFHWLMDVRGWHTWAYLFTIYGVNAIAAYFLSIFLRIHTLQEWMVTVDNDTKVNLWNWFQDILRASALGPQAGGYLFTALYVLIWGLILAWMNWKKIYWRV